MNNTFWPEIIGILWADIQAGHNYPTVRPLLAHYTSITTLEKMLPTEEIWLSNPLHMNDWEELRFGMNAGASEFRSHHALITACETAENHAALIASFDQLFNAFDSEHAMNTYVLCLTEHQPENNDGLLSMWRGYGANGGGVAVVFDTAKLKFVEHSPFIVSKVEYADQSARLKWIEDPSISTVLAANSVRRMLELNGQNSLASKVVASSIPFRP